MKMLSIKIWFLAVALMLCGSVSANEFVIEEVDPWEGFNRHVFTFNEKVDKYALKPLAKVYHNLTPKPVDRGITNFFANLNEIPSSFNSLLQGKYNKSGIAGLRFLLNTTVGIFGFFDVATELGLKQEPEDFDQTLAVWGVKQGPYLVLPFLGPSSVRGASGTAVDAVITPMNLIEHDQTRYEAWGISLLDFRADLFAAEELISGDKYLFLRDAYLQHRDYLIHDGDVEDDFGEEADFDDEDWLSD